LAAANPVYGRYNKKLKPHENINLPAALLSRFDMIFLLLDKADMAMDTKLAIHVTQVHQKLEAP
jgi:DNA replication licensing factor MCM7